MYTLQALWTQAREKLDVVNVVFANRVYKILYGELRAGGATPGRASDNFFDLGRPDLDWVGLARAWAWKRFVWRRWRALPTRSALPAAAEDPS